MAKIIQFESRDAASAAAAARIAGLVDTRLHRNADAGFVVSGGTTPGKCFEYLSGYDLSWSKVLVTLSDERWVPPAHADSNEKLVRETLLVDKASDGNILPIYDDEVSVDDRCDLLQQHQPADGFVCALVGMGTDGHFASLFPGADTLEAGLNPVSDRFYIPVRTAASPHARVSMTLNALLQSTEILLLFFGAEKLRIFEQAVAGDEQYPIATLLAQSDTPVSLYWAP